MPTAVTQNSDPNSISSTYKSSPTSSKPNFEAFNLVIYNQVGIVFSGDAKSLACTNNKGDFSILPGHANFISLVTQPITVVLADDTIKKFEVGLGVVRVLNNQIEIYTGLLIDEQTQNLAAGIIADTKDTELKVDELKGSKSSGLSGLFGRWRRS